MEDKEYKRLEKKLLSRNADLIERVLESFGLKVRIVEVNIEKEYTEYCLEIAVGTNLEELEKHSRDIALAVASPTGKINMIIPIPGRSLIGIQIPKPTKADLLKMKELGEKTEIVEKTWREKIALGFYVMSKLFEKIAEKILKTENNK